MAMNCASIRQSRIPVINPSLTTLSPLLRAGNKTGFFERAVMAKEAGPSTFHMDFFDTNFVGKGGQPDNRHLFLPDLAKELRDETGLPIDAHFMVRPSTLGGLDEFNGYLSSFEGAVDFMSIHPGAFVMDNMKTPEMHKTIEAIRGAGASPGVVVNPNEAVFITAELKDAVDFALVMTVIPGDGGRGFDKRGLCNLQRLQRLSFPKLLAVDGAITGETIKAPFEAGARWFVVGSYWFGKEGSYKTLEEMRAAYRALIGATGSV